ncbi:MAG: hypothetical protein LAO78_11715 [Acidobacteriia bacterium]|nr:hypothetical protein [Terriglobia bacterium]
MDADDIAKQLSESRPIHITSEGEIIRPEDTVETANGTVERNTDQPVTQLKPQRWFAWYESHRRRLVDEKEAMEARFPSFQLHMTGAVVGWVGCLRPQNASSSYTISVVYPDDFPYAAPRVFAVDPEVSSPKHQYSDGSLCLMYPGDGTWKTNTTAVQIVTMAAAWFFCYEYHERHCGCDTVPCDYWPGEEAKHK